MCQEARQDIRGCRAWIDAIPRKFSRRTSKKLSVRFMYLLIVVLPFAFPIRRFCSFVWPACEMGVQGGHVSSQVNAPLLRTWRWDSACPRTKRPWTQKNLHPLRGAVCASKVPQKHKATKVQRTRSFPSGSKFLGSIVQESTKANNDKMRLLLKLLHKLFRAKVPK